MAREAPAQSTSQICLMGETGAMRLLSIESASDGAKPARKWKALAYTGAVVNQWFGRVVIDLAGMRPLNLAQNPIPLLLNHGWAFGDESPRLGAIGGMSVGTNGIELSGHFLSNEKVDGVVQDLDQGFPFQFSIGVEGHRTEQLQAGQKLAVNGREIVGPCEIVREWSLREGSVVALGADMDTRTVALAALSRERGTQRSIAMADAATTTADGTTTGAETKAAAAATPGAATTPATTEKAAETVAPAPAAETKAALAAGPATIVELEALKGGDAFTLASLKAGLTLAQAGAMLELRQRESAAGIADKGTADAVRLGQRPTGGAGAFAGATGEDPEQDYDNSEQLRVKFAAKKHTRDSAIAFMRSMKRSGHNYLEAVGQI